MPWLRYRRITLDTVPQPSDGLGLGAKATKIILKAGGDTVISYTEELKQGRIRVKLDGKTVGFILCAEGRYQYKTIGNTLGEVFTTLAACKRSLEAR
jgi:hypothetical protein